LGRGSADLGDDIPKLGVREGVGDDIPRLGSHEGVGGESSTCLAFNVGDGVAKGGQPECAFSESPGEGVSGISDADFSRLGETGGGQNISLTTRLTRAASKGSGS